MPWTYDQIQFGDRVVVAGTTLDGVQVAAKGYIYSAIWTQSGPSIYSTGYRFQDNTIEISMGESFRAVFPIESVAFYSWEERPDIPDPTTPEIETRKEIRP